MKKTVSPVISFRVSPQDGIILKEISRNEGFTSPNLYVKNFLLKNHKELNKPE